MIHGPPNVYFHLFVAYTVQQETLIVRSVVILLRYIVNKRVSEKYEYFFKSEIKLRQNGFQPCKLAHPAC